MTTEMRQQAWQEHRRRLHAFVLRRVDDPAAAEDIVHDVLVRALEKFDSLRAGDRVEAWLYQITRNAVTDHYRTRVPDALQENDAGVAEEVPSATVRAELAHCLRPLMDRLPESYRAALELSELAGLTQRETAEQLGLTLSGAKSRVQRGRRLLQDEILACCRLEFDSRGSLMSFDRRNGCAPDPDEGCGTCT